VPAICAASTLPKSVQRYTSRSCRLFNVAATLENKPRARARRLRQGARALERAVSAVVRAQRRGLAPECAAALAEEYRATASRATGLSTNQP
jgi:ribosomal protein L44E